MNIIIERKKILNILFFQLKKLNIEYIALL